VKAFKSFLFFWGLCFSLFFFAQISFAQDEPNLLIRPECQETFQKGIEYYFAKIEKKDIQDLEDRIKEVTPICRAEFSMGFFEGQLNAAKLIVFEYLLDKEQTKVPVDQVAFERQLLDLFKSRWKVAELPDEYFDQILSDTDFLRLQLESLKSNLFDLSKKKRKAILFGRFVFAPNNQIYTHWNYKFNSEGSILRLENGALDQEPGSYQRTVELLEKHLRSNYEEYMNWKPSTWFGEDSLVYGAARRKVDEPSIREIKENSYFEFHRLLSLRAKSLGLDLKPFYKIEMSMLEKQRAYLDYHIKVAERVVLLYRLAPAFPLALHLGAIGISYSFGLSATAAANISSGVALASFAALNTYIAVKSSDLKRNNVTEEMDYWLPIVTTTLPLSMMAPTVLGAGTSAVKYLWVEGIAFWQILKNSANWMRTTSSLDKLQFIKQLPATSVRNWYQYWFKYNEQGVRSINYSKVGYIVAVNSAAVIAEIVDREFIRNDPKEKFFLEGGKINPVSIYKLIPGAAWGIVYTPVMNVNNYFSRYLIYRTVDLLSNASVYMVVKKDADIKYFAFDILYGGTGSSYFGELSRAVTLSIMNSGYKNQTQFLLNFAFSIASVFPRTSIRNYFMSLYRYGVDEKTAEQLKVILAKEAHIQINEFSNEEINEAMKDFLKNPEVYSFLEKNPSN
jgi:hypothetical protein